ncbi:MAG: DUF357 domain-containing protein [Candidatus Micrarchaeia archaeon]|jgi:hypothetical protein
MKDIKERIEIDLRKFEDSIKEVDSKAKERYKHIIDLAERYYSDTKYFIEKDDLITAFGAIVYAHGLIDALKKLDEQD